MQFHRHAQVVKFSALELGDSPTMCPAPRPGDDFEERVRTVARALWGLPPGEGGSELYGSNQIDCVCRTEDVVHLIECTIDRSQEKLLKQIQKLLNAQRDEQRRGSTVKMWIITPDEPIAEQRSLAKKDAITILSIEQFESRLFDAPTYLDLRWKYPFGSATDPDSERPILPDDEYIPLPLKDFNERTHYDLDEIADLILSGKRVVLTGPYGAGKSLTVRELFRVLRARWHKRQIKVIPVALNLRDHWGQTDVDEALRRHASKIGFDKPDQLVRSWNAEQLVVLLDGFDELATQTWRVGPEATRRARRDALRLTRAFARRARTSILISGRDHYFDSDREMIESLGLAGLPTVLLTVDEFTEEQAQAYLKKKRGRDVRLPTWLPRKPLLLGYLAARNLLDQVLAIDGERGPAYAWDQFLDRICQRDATMAEDIEAPAVRQILEYLATRTRESVSGNGPLYDADLAEAYRSVTGYDPLPSSMVLLQRLPGLTARDQEAGARSFVDAEMAEALRAGTVSRYIRAPWGAGLRDQLRHPLSEFGCSVAALLTEGERAAEAQYRVAAKFALERVGQPTLALDCLVAGALRMQDDGLECGGLAISDGLVDVLDLDVMWFKDLHLDSCVVTTLRLGDLGATGLALAKCLFGRVEGAADLRGLPAWIVEPAVDAFDDTRTNAAILRLDVPVPVRVLLTIIRKLFVQRGRGRKESALHRGLDGASKRYVDAVLAAMEGEKIVFRTTSGGGTIWHGERNQLTRMMEILAAPKASRDSLVTKVRSITL